MATTREYTDYINDQVDIAPANSQEEYQAAELIEDLFVQHGLETQIQEFDAPTASGVSSRIYLIILFLGVLLAGFIGTPVSLVGLALVAISFILLAFAKNGSDFFASAGPRARSQNVIGVHRATGPNVIKGNRPIVIIAHYDTPRENFLYNSQLAKWQPLIKRLSWPLSIAVAVLACMQIIPFVPDAARHVFWVLGVLAALPLLLLGSASVYERFANCTTGANDNKASVAAMLGVLDMVRPAPDDAKAWAETHPRGVRREIEEEIVVEDDPYNPDAWDEDELDEEGLSEEYDEESQEGSSAESYEEEKHSFASRIPFFGHREQEVEVEEPEQDEYGLQSPSTVRRGAAVLESLQVLPETCVIEYENLTPREEVIARIESDAADGFSESADLADDYGEDLGGGFGSAGAGIAGFFATIRAFFARIAARFTGKEFPEIERGQTQQIYSQQDDEYEASDESEFVDEYGEDDVFEQYDEDEFEDDEYEGSYDEDYDYEDLPQNDLPSQEVSSDEWEAPVVAAPAADIVEESAPATEDFTPQMPETDEPAFDPDFNLHEEDRVQAESDENATLWTPDYVEPEDEIDQGVDQEDLQGTAAIPRQQLASEMIDADLGIAREYDESFGLADEGDEDLEAQHNIYVPQDLYDNEGHTKEDRYEEPKWVRPSFIPEDAEYELLDDDDDYYESETFEGISEGVPVEVVDVPAMNDSYDIPELDSIGEIIDEGEQFEFVDSQAEPVEPVAGTTGYVETFVEPVVEGDKLYADVDETAEEPVAVVFETVEEIVVNEDGEQIEVPQDEFIAEETLEATDVTVEQIDVDPEAEATSTFAPVAIVDELDVEDEPVVEAVDEYVGSDDIEPVDEAMPEEPAVVEATPVEVESDLVEDLPVAEPVEAADEEPVAELVVDEVETEAPADVIEQVVETAEDVSDGLTIEAEEPSVDGIVEDDDAALWTPSDFFFDDDLDEPDGFGAESETTLAFKKLTGEELEAYNAQVKSAQEQASSILHEMFETAPEQERYTPPRTSNVLHEMFATLPYIESVPVEEPAPRVDTVVEEPFATDEVVAQEQEPAEVEAEIAVEQEPEAVAIEDVEELEPAEAEETVIEAAEPETVEALDVEETEPEFVEATVNESVIPEVIDAIVVEDVESEIVETAFDDDQEPEQESVAEAEPMSVEEAPVEETSFEDEYASVEAYVPEELELVEVEDSEAAVVDTAELFVAESAEEERAPEPAAEEDSAAEQMPIEEATYVGEGEIIFEDTSVQDEEEAIANLWDAPVEEVISTPIEEVESNPLEEVLSAPVPLAEMDDEFDEIDEIAEEIAEAASEVAIDDHLDTEMVTEPVDDVVEAVGVAYAAEEKFVETLEEQPEPINEPTESAEDTFVRDEIELPVVDDVNDDVFDETDEPAEVTAEFEPVVQIEEPVEDELPLAEFEVLDAIEEAEELEETIEPEATAEPEPESVPEEVLDQPAAFEPEDESEPESESVAAQESESSDSHIMSGLTFSSEEDVSEDELEDKDITGLTTFSVEAEADAEDSIPAAVESIPKPRAVDDPDWGKSTFKPSVMSAGRRAMLLDLPDPSVMAVDPLSKEFVEDGADDGQPAKVNDEAMKRFEVLRSVPSPLDEPKTSSSEKSEPEQAEPKTEAEEPPMPRYNKTIGSRTPKKNHKRKIRFGRKRKEEEQPMESMGEWLGLDDDYDAKKDGRQIGTWDNFSDDDDDKKWKGGATLRAGLRDDDDLEDEYYESSVGLPNFDSLDLMPEDEADSESEIEQDVAEVDDAEDAEAMDPETMEELREAVLRLGDDDLIAHDIWFVGVGASSLDHAGIKAFLDEHRRDIRGAFLVNLDSIGAGDLTLLTNEGMGRKRRADRRMGRMITSIADALHIDLGHADYSWDETDATPAMQLSVRVGTLMGVSEDGLPANSHTVDDEPEYLNDQQIANVADIIAELIRRS